MSEKKVTKLTEEDKKLIVHWLEDALEKIKDSTICSTIEDYGQKKTALQEIQDCIKILKGQGKDIKVTPFELLNRVSK